MKQEVSLMPHALVGTKKGEKCYKEAISGYDFLFFYLKKASNEHVRFIAFSFRLI
jgi:hypothetical protein